MEYNCWVFHTVGPCHLIFALCISGWRRLRLPMQEDWGTMRQGITALHSLPGEVQRVVGRDEIQTRYVTKHVFFDSDVFSQCVTRVCWQLAPFIQIWNPNILALPDIPNNVHINECSAAGDLHSLDTILLLKRFASDSLLSQDRSDNCWALASQKKRCRFWIHWCHLAH